MRLLKITEKDLRNILDIISKFINKESSVLPINLRKNVKVVHYYNEIIRFWNKLNFIVKKTQRDFNSLSNRKVAKYLYATYRIIWEKASEKTIINELKTIDKKYLNRIRSFSWKKALEDVDEKVKFSINEAIPSFMVNRLLPVMGYEFLKENINYMNYLEQNVEISIRINKLTKTNLREEEISSAIKENFKINSISFYEDPDIADLFQVPKTSKNKILDNSFYKNGFLIFQDKASAAVIQVLSPEQSDLICDMCAAPGIKTSLIAQYMRNNGYIIAGDFLTTRIRTMKKLLNQLNVLNSFLINTDSITFPIRFENYFDRILLDAPCTGSGTFLTNPELKWRQNEKFLYQNITLQKKLLKSALKLLKPYGILVYSTCSLYPEEGEYQILDIIDNVEPLDLPTWFSPSYTINGSTVSGTGRLFPSLHHTQGFFIGKFKKKDK